MLEFLKKGCWWSPPPELALAKNLPRDRLPQQNSFTLWRRVNHGLIFLKQHAHAAVKQDVRLPPHGGMILSIQVISLRILKVPAAASLTV